MEMPNIHESKLELEKISNDQTDSLLYAIVFFFTVTVLGMFGNSVSVAYHGFCIPKTTVNTIIVFLGSVDFLACLATIGNIVEMFCSVTFTSKAGCKILALVNHWMVTTSGFTVAMVSLDRYRHVCRPFGWQFTKTSTVVTFACMALFAFVLSLRDILVFDILPIDIAVNSSISVTGHYCTQSDEKHLQPFITFFHYVDIIVFLALTLSTAFAYILIVRELVISRKRITRHLSIPDVNSSPNVYRSRHRAASVPQRRVSTEDTDESEAENNTIVEFYLENDAQDIFSKPRAPHRAKSEHDTRNGIGCATRGAHGRRTSKVSDRTEPSALHADPTYINNCVQSRPSWFRQYSTGDQAFKVADWLGGMKVTNPEISTNFRNCHSKVTNTTDTTECQVATDQSNVFTSRRRVTKTLPRRRTYPLANKEVHKPAPSKTSNQVRHIDDITHLRNIDHSYKSVHQNLDEYKHNRQDVRFDHLSEQKPGERYMSRNGGADGSKQNRVGNGTKHRHTEDPDDNNSDLELNDDHTEIRRTRSSSVISIPRHERQITIMMSIITVLSFVSFVPYFFVNLFVKDSTGDVVEREFNSIIQIALRSYKLHNALNPYIICLFQVKFRHYMKRVLFRFRE